MSIFFLLIIFIWVWIGNAFYDSVLNRKKINPKNIDIVSNDDLLFMKREVTKSFHFLKNSTDMEEITIMSKDGIQLHGYYVPNQGPKWVILCHGYLSTARSMSQFAEFYYSEGYNVLMVDARAHGRSHGSKITMGSKESLDVVTWILWILNRHTRASVVLHGLSLGASSILMSTKYHLPKGVKALVSDSAYTSAYDIFYDQLHIRFGVLTFPILLSASLMTRFRGDFSVKETSSVQAVKQNKIPTLYFHAKEDDFIPPNMTEELFKYNKGEKELHIVKGNHGMGSFENGEKYYTVLKEFLDKHMGV